MLIIDREPLLTHIDPIEPKLLEGDLIQPGHALFGMVWINRERVSGTPCFYGTRVPITTLFNCLTAGQTLDQFLDDFDGVSREQAEAVLLLAQSQLLSGFPTP